MALGFGDKLSKISTTDWLQSGLLPSLALLTTGKWDTAAPLFAAGMSAGEKRRKRQMDERVLERERKIEENAHLARIAIAESYKETPERAAQISHSGEYGKHLKEWLDPPAAKDPWGNDVGTPESLAAHDMSVRGMSNSDILQTQAKTRAAASGPQGPGIADLTGGTFTKLQSPAPPPGPAPGTPSELPSPVEAPTTSRFDEITGVWPTAKLVLQNIGAAIVPQYGIDEQQRQGVAFFDKLEHQLLTGLVESDRFAVGEMNDVKASLPKRGFLSSAQALEVDMKVTRDLVAKHWERYRRIVHNQERTGKGHTDAIDKLALLEETLEMMDFAIQAGEGADGFSGTTSTGKIKFKVLSP
jgi:hypothetical protein